MNILRGSLEGADCQNCPLAKDGKPNEPVFGIGPENPKWICIGEGPGRNEVKLGSPFVGESGKCLSRALSSFRVNRSEIWIDNATLCRPGPGQDEKVRMKAAEACSGRLKKQLANFPEKPILALGAVATKSVVKTNLTKITDLAGTYHRSNPDGTGERSIIPSIHPASFLRASGGKQVGAKGSGTGFWSLLYDIAKIEAISRGIDIVFSQDIDYEWENQTRANNLVLDIINEIYEGDKFLGCDLETFVEDPERHSAKWPFVAKIKTIGIGTEKRAISVYWGLLTEDTIDKIRSLLEDDSIRKSFHNRIYDAPVFNANGFLVKGPIDDTLLAHHVAFPGMKHNLQSVVSQFWAVPPWKAEFRDGKESPKETTIYNALDTLGTARLPKALKPHIEKRGLQKLYEMDCRMGEIAGKMHLRGIPISREVNGELAEKLLTIINDARDRLEEKAANLFERIKESLAFERAATKRKKDSNDLEERVKTRLAEIEKEIAKGKFVWNASNTGHVIALLKAQNVPLYAKTKSGKTSTKADVLEGLAHIPEVRDILQYRGHINLYTSFVQRMFEWTEDSQGGKRPPWVQDDERIHPTWSVHKISGRWGAVDPAVMNWTKGNEKAVNPMERTPNLRRQIVAPDGRMLVGFDYAQLEVRIMALLSKDPFLMDIFRNDKDIHVEFGRIIFPTLDSMTEYERKRARDVTKRFEYGALYGGDDDTIWKTIVVDHPEYTPTAVAQAVRQMKMKVKGFLKWQQETYAKACRPPFEIYSYLYKRTRAFPLGNPPKTEINNQPMQSTGADIMATGLDVLDRRLEQEFVEAFPIIQIHDFVGVECFEKDADRVKKVIIESMTQEYEGIPFPVDVKIGKSLAEV